MILTSLDWILHATGLVSKSSSLFLLSTCLSVTVSLLGSIGDCISCDLWRFLLSTSTWSFRSSTDDSSSSHFASKDSMVALRLEKNNEISYIHLHSNKNTECGSLWKSFYYLFEIQYMVLKYFVCWWVKLKLRTIGWSGEKDTYGYTYNYKFRHMF